jgi:hypothetical protein
LIPNPIHRVLSTLTTQGVRHLLMGGQACVLYGAAEFSRDTDIVLVADAENLERLQRALAELQAQPIAVPPFEREYLLRGHAVHFRCGRPDVRELRLDIMAVLRAVDAFPELWRRRTTWTMEDGPDLELLSLPDLVRAKKTQRDKDWPMIRRLVEANYRQYEAEPGPERIAFWLQESRTPSLLVDVAHRFPQAAEHETPRRPLLAFARRKDETGLSAALYDEEQRERTADRVYWQPLRAELEQLRHRRQRPR